MTQAAHLPVYDPDDCPLCWYGATHDCFGDHAYLCVQNNKKMASNYTRDGWAGALQPALAIAGYIHPSAKLETEKPGLSRLTLNARPLDLSFDPNPDPDPLHLR